MKQLAKPVIVLTLIAFFCTAALAGVNLLTRGIISDSEARAAQAAMGEMLDDPQGFEPVELDSELLKTYNTQSVHRAKSGLGYIVQASARGYGGDVNLMLAFSPAGEILSVRVLSHEETNGVGTRAVDSADYLAQFAGKSAQKGGQVQAVAGATISSSAVVAGVNNAANLLTAAQLTNTESGGN